MFHILIADDDDDDQFILCDAIRSRYTGQVKVSQVFDGTELVTWLNNACDGKEGYVLPDAVLLDINMTVLDGFETLRQIKIDRRTAQVPVFVLTTMRDTRKVAELRAMGAAGFFKKPDHIADYVAIMETIIKEVPQCTE